MKRVEQITYAAALLVVADPAFAGLVQVPAPAAGIGIGAVALIGLGYRVLKRRINP